MFTAVATHLPSNVQSVRCDDATYFMARDAMSENGSDRKTQMRKARRSCLVPVYEWSSLKTLLIPFEFLRAMYFCVQ